MIDVKDSTEECALAEQALRLTRGFAQWPSSASVGCHKGGSITTFKISNVRGLHEGTQKLYSLTQLQTTTASTTHAMLARCS